MAVAFDALGPSSAGKTGSVTTTTGNISWSHTCSGSNRILIVGAALGVGTNDTGVTMSATYNSVAMTSIGTVHANNTTLGFSQLWGIINPPTGANTVQVSYANAPHTANDDIVAGSISFTGCDQTTGWGTPQTATGNSTAPSVTIAAATGDMVVDVVGTGTGVTSSNQTMQWHNNFSTGSGDGSGGQSTAAGATSVTMSYVVTTDYWGILAVRILAVGAAAGTTIAWLTA